MSPEPDYRTGECQGSAEAVTAEGAATEETAAGGAAPEGAATERAAAPGTGTDSEADEMPRSYICVVCQRPIGGEADRRWKGEPVHLECGAELRCGVSVGPSFDG